MGLGDRAFDPDGLRLLHATVDGVAAAYAACVDLAALGEPVIGLVQQVYWDATDPDHWAPLTLAVPERKAVWCAAHGQLDLLWRPYELDGMDFELAGPDVYGDPGLNAVCQALLDHIVREGEDELAGRYFLALAAQLHAVFGVPVVTEDPDGGIVAGADAQALAQLTPEERDRWVARGWIDLEPEIELHPDTVLHLRLENGRVAGIYRLDSHLLVTGALSPWCGGTGLGEHVTALSGDPAVVAGLLPSGATGARVQDLYDRWHDAVTAEGAWLAVLPHEGRGGPPPVEFLAGDGSVVKRVAERASVFAEALSVALEAEPFPGGRDQAEEELAELRSILAHATVTALWPADAPTGPELRGWTGEDDRASGVALGAGALQVEVEDGREDMLDEPEDRARDLLESSLRPRIGDRAAARVVIEARPQALPGSIDGRAETFALLAASGAWVATWRDRRTELHITVNGLGDPPAGLDLVPARV